MEQLLHEKASPFFLTLKKGEGRGEIDPSGKAEKKEAVKNVSVYFEAFSKKSGNLENEKI